MDKTTLDLLGWDVDFLDGDISAPNTLSYGGMKSDGMFGPGTCFVPREWEAHEVFGQRLARFLLKVN